MASILATAGAIEHHEDPLLAAINLARFLGEQYEDLPEDIEEAEDTVEFQRLVAAPDAVLRCWAQPATTRESAAAALHVALEMSVIADVEYMRTMIYAALGFLEGRAQ